MCKCNGTVKLLHTIVNQLMLFFIAIVEGQLKCQLMFGEENGYPYLQAVATPGEDTYEQYKSEVELTKQEIIEKIKQKHSNIEINFENSNDIQIIEYTDSGRVRTVKFGNINLSGVEARSIFGLKSANFSIEQTDNTIKFTVLGYGHGVGMSQTGADSLAKHGKNWEEIVKHFYTGVEISEM